MVFEKLNIFWLGGEFWVWSVGNLWSGDQRDRWSGDEDREQLGLGEVVKIDRVINNDEKEVGLSKEIAVLMKQKLCVDELYLEMQNII